jgi:hypothetical protein
MWHHNHVAQMCVMVRASLSHLKRSALTPNGTQSPPVPLFLSPTIPSRCASSQPVLRSSTFALVPPNTLSYLKQYALTPDGTQSPPATFLLPQSLSVAPNGAVSPHFR